MTRLFEARPFIIAEVGSNWENLDHCLESIAAAKAVGADAVKFQAFSVEALYGFYDSMHSEHRHAYELKIDRLPLLKEKADACGIEFMCTAFSPELVAAVDPYVSVHKVASSDAAWPQMLEAVAKTEKPVLISFGGKTEADRKAAMALLQGRCHYGRDDIVPLYCVASYPADYVGLPDFSVESGYDGYSDHTIGHTAAVEAARRGAIVIEKHFTAFPDLDTPDRNHSLTPSQFKRMVDLIRGRQVESEEKDMFLRHNRRLIATRDIAPGETLQYGHNFGAYRSLVDDTRGLSPFDWQRAEGKPAGVALKRGQAIGEGDF